MQVNGVTVIADSALTNDEIISVVEEEIKLWKESDRTLSSIELAVEGDQILVKAQEKSPIRRLRRITGYLSNLENFNSAKLSECSQRAVHT
jgi:anaerobic ribonucleoside-triphosphate reductase activating protein